MKPIITWMWTYIQTPILLSILSDSNYNYIKLNIKFKGNAIFRVMYTSE